MADPIKGDDLGNVLTGTKLGDTLLGLGGGDTLNGLGGDDLLDGGTGADTMTGGAGNDRYFVDDAGDQVVELAKAGTDTIESSISLTLPDNVEELVLVGNAITATGNGFSNVLRGNDLDNVLDGGGAISLSKYVYPVDQLYGGEGNDTYLVGNGNWEVIENAGEGTDTIRSTSGFTLPENVENGVMLGTGNDIANGNALDNVITGNSGNNEFRESEGRDTLIGGAGDDTYRIYSILGNKTKLVEVAGGGNDTVIINGDYSGDFVLPDNIENLTADFYSNSVVLHGNTGNNVLTGNYQADYLDGGAGADVMRGGGGNDTYVVDNVGDVIEEAVNIYETNSVISSISYILPQGTQNLTLIGSKAFNATGNDFSNVITGNALANVIDGKGGFDTLIGGKGDDTYTVHWAIDVVTENAGEGRDAVICGADMTDSYTLSANIEGIGMAEGSQAASITGNALANVMTGNALANVIDGGAGADTMSGRAGDDTYVVDSKKDQVIEAADGGTDTVRASFTYVLGANVENLELTGTGNIDGYGNALDNVITGNGGSNILIAAGGHDTLIGGAGDDRYVIRTAEFTLIEQQGEGTDTVFLSASLKANFVLPDNIENITADSLSFQGQTLTGNDLDNVLKGTRGNDYIDGGVGADVMHGDSGSDTYVVDNSSDVIEELYGVGGTDLVMAKIDFVLNSALENLTLVGPLAQNGTGSALNNRLTGNAFDNVLDGKNGEDTLLGMDGNDTLIGGNGADTLDGGAGQDTMRGGADDDVYIVDNAGDIVFETRTGGKDRVETTISFTLGDNIEQMVLKGTQSINGTGNALDNIIAGNAAANEIDGKAGADRMVGWEGDDTYHVDNVGDQTVELAAWGHHDKVICEVGLTGTYVLAENIEEGALADGARLTLLVGNDLANTLTGNALANRLDGGAGTDVMAGGAGDDTYVLDSKNDRVTELAGGGSDTIETGFSFALGDTLENLTLTGAAAINGTGNAAANVLIGNAGANRLVGGSGDDQLSGGDGNDLLVGDGGSDVLDGGTGTDTLRGGLGDDSYRVDDAGDVVTEKAGEGRDSVQAWVDWSLGANLEDMTLVGPHALKGTGNARDNVITGNEFNNVLSGGGGEDTLIGGLGDDTYLFDAASVTVTEKAGGGFDRMVFSASGAMASNVEVGVASGSGAVAINGRAGDEIIGGNDAANVLDGGGGNDTLIGHGGADTLRGGAGNDFLFGGFGSDTLTGGAGSDQFAVGTNAQQGVDTITDFISGTDTLLVVNPYISGKLLAGGLVFGTDAKEADDIAIYDKASGNLYVDYDGNEAGAKVLLAKFAPGTDLAASDILLIDEVSFSQQIAPVELLL